MTPLPVSLASITYCGGWVRRYGCAGFEVMRALELIDDFELGSSSSPHGTNQESPPDHQRAAHQPVLGRSATGRPALEGRPIPPARLDGGSCRSRPPAGARHPRGLWRRRAHRAWAWRCPPPARRTSPSRAASAGTAAPAPRGAPASQWRHRDPVHATRGHVAGASSGGRGLLGRRQRRHRDPLTPGLWRRRPGAGARQPRLQGRCRLRGCSALRHWARCGARCPRQDHPLTPVRARQFRPIAVPVRCLNRPPLP